MNAEQEHLASHFRSFAEEAREYGSPLYEYLGWHIASDSDALALRLMSGGLPRPTCCSRRCTSC